MKHKLKRSLISSISVLALTAVLVDVSYASGGLVESCSVNTSMDSGGVSLNKTLTLLNSMGDIQGAAYDPKKGRIVFTSLGGADVVLEDDDPIEMDDLVVAVRAIYGPLDEAGKITAPGVSFDAASNWTATGQDDVRYIGNTENTSFGQLLFDADYVLKTLGQGVNEGGVLLKNISALMAAAPGYQSLAEKYIFYRIDLGGLAVQLWIEPKMVALDEFSEGVTEYSARSFKFANVEMQVLAKFYTEDSNGDLTEFQGTVPALLALRVNEFLDHINLHYDAIAQVEGFEALEKLKRLAKLVAVVRWMKTEHIPMDLSFMANYTPTHTPTPEKVNVLQLCYRDNYTVDGAKSGLFGGKGCGAAIYGGVQYVTANTYSSVSTNPLAASLDEANVVGGSLANEGMTWRFTKDAVEYKAHAQTLSQQRKDGNVTFGSLDLGLPNGAGQSLSLYRSYNSFANDVTGFGPGWSEFPFAMSIPESEVVVCEAEDTVCTKGLGVLIGYPKINVADHLTGRTVPFDVAGSIGWGGSKVTPYYLTAHSNDWVYVNDNDNYVYEQRDSHNQVTKIAVFKPRPAQYGTVLYADVILVGALGIGPDENSNLIPDGIPDGIPNGIPDGLWTSYISNTAGQLEEIRSSATNAHILLSYEGERISSAQLVAGAQSRSVEYRYNFNRLENVKLSNGQLIKYVYEDQTEHSSGVISDVIDVTRNTTLASLGFDFENRERVLISQNNTSRQVDTDYDRPSGLMTSTDGLGRVSVVERDEKTRLEGRSVSANVDGELVTHGISYVYNPANDVVGPETVTGMRNETTTFTYDSQGNVTSATLDDLAQSMSIERGLRMLDDGGYVSVKVLTDAKDRKSALEYDVNGKVINIHRRITGVTSQSMTWDENGHLGSVHDIENPSANTVQLFSYTPKDGYSQSISYDPGTGVVSRVTYDSSALNSTYPWIASVDEKVQYNAIDEHGQAETIISAAGYTTTLQYDDLSRLYSKQGPADTSATTIAYYETGLAQDSPKTVTTPIGVTTQSYDLVKRIQRATDARGVTTASFRNADGRLTRVVEAGLSGKTVLTTRYFYDVHGRLDRKLLPNNATVEYGYDEFGRLKSMTEVEGGGVDVGADLVLVSTPSPVVNIEATSSFSFDVDATSSLDEGISYYLISGPDDLVIDEVTGEMSWNASGVSAGGYVVVIQAVSDSGGITDYSFSVNVHEGTFTLDSDGDSIYDIADNCIYAINTDQLDTDSDGFGNACDPDLNNDGIVNFADLALFKSWYGSSDVDADFNGDGAVDDADRNVLDAKFGDVPGPSANAN